MNENNDEIKINPSGDDTDNNSDTTPAAETNEKKDTKKKKSWKREVWEWVYTLAIAIAVAFLIKGFVFDVVRVDGHSMEMTLSHNDRLIVTKLGYKPEQGDIIILDSTYEKREAYFDILASEKGKEHLNGFEKFFAERKDMPSELKTRYYVKRVIALPGQTVDLVDGYVYVDGEKLDEPYAYVDSPSGGKTHNDARTYSIDASVEYPITVEDNCVFVMGDHRNASKDSRSSELGQVPYEAILGKSQLRIWPLNAMSVTR